MEATTNDSSTDCGQSALTAGLGVSFAPSVAIDGRALTPAGWMWVVSFALAGCEWAVAEASKPEFRTQVADWMRERKRVEAEQEIAALEQRIANIRASMKPNAELSGPRPLAAEGSRSNDVLGNGGK